VTLEQRYGKLVFTGEMKINDADGLPSNGM
jgi:hypothetical protein